MQNELPNHEQEKTGNNGGSGISLSALCVLGICLFLIAKTAGSWYGSAHNLAGDVPVHELLSRGTPIALALTGGEAGIGEEVGGKWIEAEQISGDTGANRRETRGSDTERVWNDSQDPYKALAVEFDVAKEPIRLFLSKALQNARIKVTDICRVGSPSGHATCSATDIRAQGLPDRRGALNWLNTLSDTVKCEVHRNQDIYGRDYGSVKDPYGDIDSGNVHFHCEIQTIELKKEIKVEPKIMDSGIADWFNRLTKDTPLKDKGGALLSICSKEWGDDEARWHDSKNKWINYCVKITYAVAKQEQHFCVRQVGRDTNNCWSIHPSDKEKSYVKWDGRWKYAGTEKIRIYDNVEDSMQDFVHLLGTYYYIPIMRNPLGMRYASDPNWRSNVVSFYNES